MSQKMGEEMNQPSPESRMITLFKKKVDDEEMTAEERLGLVCAKMPDGKEINGIGGLQNALLEQEDKFLRCLVEKLATFALGRGMEYSDREWLDSLVTNMQSNGKTLRGLIKDIVASDQFKTK